jgi:hypothetical protein
MLHVKVSSTTPDTLLLPPAAASGSGELWLLAAVLLLLLVRSFRDLMTSLMAAQHGTAWQHPKLERGINTKPWQCDMGEGLLNMEGEMALHGALSVCCEPSVFAAALPAPSARSSTL